MYHKHRIKLLITGIGVICKTVHKLETYISYQTTFIVEKSRHEFKGFYKNAIYCMLFCK